MNAALQLFLLLYLHVNYEVDLTELLITGFSCLWFFADSINFLS